MWNSSNLIFFLALIFFLIQPPQEKSEKPPHIQAYKKPNAVGMKKWNSYLCQGKNKIN